MTQLTPEAASISPAARPVNRIPRASYRLQLRVDFGFNEVRQLVDYLDQLGISDLYLSPLFHARKDSSHGYDVVQHSTIEREFGGAAAFEAMADDARRRGMGILLDVVPNHMGINDPGNRWWNDVLENGELSHYARFFDIDWHRLAENLRHKILLPVLGDRFGDVLERGELRLVYEAGRFHLAYHEHKFPLSPLSWPAVLSRALSHVPEPPPPDINNPPTVSARIELESIISQLNNLPPKSDHSNAAARERYREQTVASRRLAELLERSSEVRAALEMAIEEMNGTPGQSTTFDALEALIDEQWYRLAFWRVAGDEINYRRFFDINDLAAIRVEEPEVFQAVHSLVEQLLADDRITGVRIDHPDGLLDPRGYFQDLQKLYQRCRPTTEDEQTATQLYVVVEKILTGDEPLPGDWPVCGTTGYELLNDLNRVFVDASGVERLRREYGALTGVDESPAEVVYQSKKRILDDSMSGEMHVLAGQLHRLAQRHRMSRDFTFSALLRALRELVACFPVYRTYVPPRGWDVDDADYGRITTALRFAKRRNPTMGWTALEFVASVLLLQFPTGVDEPDREEFRAFVLKFQQVTGPVTAKGIEDTAFYRYYPLASLNEVGGELDAKPLSIDEFHRLMQHRADDWPHALSATATHDTKRGEDLRACLHVLSEVADTWLETVRRWQELNRPLLRTVGSQAVPDRNEEYMLYQTLVGTWPLTPLGDERQQYTDRIVEYMQKFLREAKLATSWANPAEEYENAALGFARDLVDPQRSPQFLEELSAFVATIADAGFVNGLAQVILKSTVPGVPDFYRGTELWDFNLVDPDNRRPVDYAGRQHMLAELRGRVAEDATGLQRELLRAWPDPRVKLFATWRTLRLRAEEADVFQQGAYIPLAVSGAHADHVLAFARRYGDHWIVAATALRIQELLQTSDRAESGPPVIHWQDTRIELPSDAPHHWKDAFFGTPVECESTDEGTIRIAAERLLSPLPVGLLRAPA